MRFLRRHITYANVASTLALALAVGGGGVYAAEKIGGGEIKKGAVSSPQIKNRQVRRQDIAGGSINSRKVSNGTLTGKDVDDDSLTGHDVQESSLAAVPLAQAVNGVNVRVVRASRSDTTALVPVFSEGGMSGSMDCGGGSADFQFRATASGDRGTLFEPAAGIQLFDSTTPQSLSTTTATAGFATVRRADGTVTRFDYELRQLPNGFGTQDDCFVSGVLLTGK